MNKQNYSCYLNYLSTIIIILIVIRILYNMFFNKSNILRDRLAEKTAKSLVLSCMDFRFVNDTIGFLNKDYNDSYNKFSLAGASLGYNQEKYSDWGTAFEKHIALSKMLHNIDEIIVVDHMDCGAYRIFHNDPEMTKEKEYQLHRENLAKFKEVMNEKHPSLKISTFLVETDGNVEEKF